MKPLFIIVSILGVFGLVTFNHAYGQNVIVYAETSMTESDVHIQIFTDISNCSLLSFGVKLSYSSEYLAVLNATKNDAIWYFGDSVVNSAYINPYTGTSGEIIYLGGKLDINNPLSGVSGTRVLLGEASFSRVTSDLPLFSLSLGRSGDYKNFVTSTGVLLDEYPGGIEFITVNPIGIPAISEYGMIILFLLLILSALLFFKNTDKGKCIIAIIFLVFVFQIPKVESKIYSSKFLTNNSTSDSKITVHKNWICWLGTNQDGYGVLMQDMNGGQIANITVQAGIIFNGQDFIEFPSMNDGICVFRYHESDNNTDYIYLYNGVTAQMQLITQFSPGEFGGGAGYPPSYSCLRPMINMGQIVWAQWDGNDYEIMFYNGANITQISDNSYNDYEPQIHNGIISWTGETTPLDVFVYNGSIIQNITSSLGYHSEDSFINSGNVAFCSKTVIGDERADYDIFVWDGTSIDIYSPTFGNDFEPEINENGIVAWTNYGRIQEVSDRTLYASDGYKVYSVFHDLNIPSPRKIALQSIYDSKIIIQAFDGNDLEVAVADYITGYFTPSTPGNVIDIEMDGNNAFMTTDQGKLIVADISDPSAPSENNIYNINAGSRGNDILKKDNNLYVACLSGGVEIIDVSDPSVPGVTGSIALNNAIEIQTDQNTAFVSNRQDGLEIYDITNPSTPSYVTSITPSIGSTVSASINNNMAFLANRDGGMDIYDLSNISSPLFLSSYSVPNIDAVKIKIVGNYAYLLCLDYGLRIVDISNALSPILIGQCQLSGLQDNLKYEIELLHSHLIISTGDAGIFCLDIYDKTSPSIVEGINTLGDTGGFSIKNNFMYFCDGNNGMKIMSISDYMSPSVAIINDPGVVPSKIYDVDSFVLTGTGVSTSGNIIGYEWKSDIDGIFSTSNSADLQDLGYGWHNIEFRVQNSDGSWSQCKTVNYYIYPGMPIDQSEFYLRETQCRHWEVSTNLTGSFEYKFYFYDSVDNLWISATPYSSVNYADVPSQINENYQVRLIIRNQYYVGWYEVRIFADGNIYSCDSNDDCDVDGEDLFYIATEFGRTDCLSGGVCKYDIDNDGDVDLDDLEIFSNQYGYISYIP